MGRKEGVLEAETRTTIERGNENDNRARKRERKASGGNENGKRAAETRTTIERRKASGGKRAAETRISRFERVMLNNVYLVWMEPATSDATPHLYTETKDIPFDLIQ